MRRLGSGVGLAALIGACCGVGSAVFLHTLEWATRLREHQLWLVFALPLAGLLSGLAYERWGKPIAGGNDLVLDTVHDQRTQLPLRMGPMVLIGTLLTHLFGGSAGREGTAMQMGASLADAIAHRLRVEPALRRTLIIAGIAGGFGSVFGTPVAGAVFGIEVLALGRLELTAAFPALVAAFVGDRVTRALWIVHTLYPTPTAFELSLLVVAKWVVVAALVAMVATLFIEASHWSKRTLERVVPRLPVRMLLGGIAIVALSWLVGSDRYLGLGGPTIVASFGTPAPPTFAFAWKLVFTVVTLSAGFFGGEVTPLFFIGATLGATLAPLLGLPPALTAGVAMAALFGVAANAPIALSVMAVELLGIGVLPHVLLVTLVGFLLSGHRGIYAAQRIARWKYGRKAEAGTSLRDARQRGAPW